MSYSSCEIIFKKLPEDHPGKKDKSPEDQALMLVREFIASKFYKILLGDSATPAYFFQADKSGRLNLASEAVMDLVEDDDPIRSVSLEGALNKGGSVLKAVKTSLVEHAGLVSAIMAASYLLCETDLNLGNILFPKPSPEKKWAAVVKIDHDHSLLCPEFFPLPPLLEKDQNIVQYLFSLRSDFERGFLNWMPTECEFTDELGAEGRRIVTTQLDMANEAAMGVFAAFSRLEEADIYALVTTDLPPELVSVLGEKEITDIINLLAKRLEHTKTFVASYTAEVVRSVSPPSLSRPSPGSILSTPMSLFTTPTPPVRIGSCESPPGLGRVALALGRLSLGEASPAIGTPHSLGPQSSTPLEAPTPPEV